jgi:metal-dependent amidase/aminoacylase/carboxypeptidase family protein
LKARRALRALRGLVRLKALVDGNTVKRQTEKTIHSIQRQTRIQFEIHARRRQMVEENQAIQKQLQLKAKEEKLKVK